MGCLGVTFPNSSPDRSNFKVDSEVSIATTSSRVSNGITIEEQNHLQFIGKSLSKLIRENGLSMVERIANSVLFFTNSRDMSQLFSHPSL